MESLQRVVLVVGVLVALFVTFVHPPLFTMDSGQRIDARSFCNAPQQLQNMTYKDCLYYVNATTDLPRLVTQLGVIILGTVAVGFAVGPKRTR